MALLGALSVAMRVNFFITLGLIGVLNVRAHTFKSSHRNMPTFQLPFGRGPRITFTRSLDLCLVMWTGRSWASAGTVWP
jgi:hypothetical protein